MAQISLERQVSKRSPLEAGIDRVWRFFCSVRAAVVEIVILAVLVLIGTLRGSSVPRGIADHVPGTGGLVDRWYAWDAFHSLPFMGMLTLLAVAIAICTVNRAPGIWSSIVNPTVTTTHGFLSNADLSARMAASDDRDAFAARLQEALRRRRHRVLSAERNGEIHVYADRYRWGKLGTFPFHLALILVLVGGVVGARWGFRDDEFIVPEGVTREVGHGTGVSVRVDRFSETYLEMGAPKEYRSDLTLLKDGNEVKQGSITVNNPMTYHDMVVYQSGFGQAVRIQVADKSGNLLMDDMIPLGPFQAKNNPDAPAGVLDIPPAGVRLTAIAPDTNPANRPDLDDLNLRSGQMYLQLRPLTANAALSGTVESVVNQGQTTRLGDLDVTFVREKRFTVLQIARNPAVPIFIASALLLVGGLACTFYFPHRRVRGIVSAAAGGGAMVTLAPLARRDWSGQRAFETLLDGLERDLGLPIERVRREHPPPDRAAATRQEPATT
ncbi:MAG: cytochrome c biogenesis protein ResB [Thermomicrobiales bacterium]|nr:cytochrome c biogenesis protein ResB [Thermomicrobiales bacterium]